MNVDQLAEMKPWQSPYLYCSGNPVNRIDPTGMIDGIPGQTLPEVSVTGHDGSKNNSNTSPSVQFINYANSNTPQIPRITTPTPTFNLPTNLNNKPTNNKPVTNNKELADAQKKLEDLIKGLGLGEGSMTVTIKLIKGVPTLFITASPTVLAMIKGGGNFAKLASVLNQFKEACGPIGFGLNEFLDISKVMTGEYNGQNFMTSGIINYVAWKIPEVGVVWIFLQSISAKKLSQRYSILSKFCLPCS